MVASAVRNVREINFVAGISYVVKAYPGKVTLFKAEVDPMEQPLPEDLNWGLFAKGGLDIRHVPGDHGRILYEPGLSALAAELTTRLGGGAAAGSAESSLRMDSIAETRVQLEF
jgi:thioesterase domain-containing protein